MNDLPSDLPDLDETLGGVELDELPPQRRELLLAQRLAHGLLSAAALRPGVGRERFVQQVLGRIAGVEQVVDDAALGDIDASPAELADDFDDAIVDDQVRDELLRQRVVHGLLRADAAHARASRAALIDSVVGSAAESEPAAVPAASPPDPSAEPRHGTAATPVRESSAGRTLPWRRYFIAAAIVAVAGLTVGILTGRPGRHPMLAAATQALSREAHRHFRLVVERIDSVPAQVIGTHDLWLQTGAGVKRFRASFRGENSGRQEVGGDGSEAWRINLDDESDRDVVASGEVNELFARFHDAMGLDCVRTIDVAGLISVLCGETVLEASIPVGTDRALVLFHGAGMQHPEIGEMTSILVVLTTADQALRVLEFVRTMPDTLLRYRFESLGVGEQDDDFYRRPW